MNESMAAKKQLSDGRFDSDARRSRWQSITGGS